MGQYSYYSKERQQYIKDTRAILIGGIVGVGLMYMALSRPSFPQYGEYTWRMLLEVYGMFFYVGISFVAGWKLVDTMIPRVFLALPVLGWVFYFFLKIALALFIGGSCFYGLFRLGNNAYNIYKIRKKLEQMG